MAQNMEKAQDAAAALAAAYNADEHAGLLPSLDDARRTDAAVGEAMRAAIVGFDGETMPETAPQFGPYTMLRSDQMDIDNHLQVMDEIIDRAREGKTTLLDRLRRRDTDEEVRQAAALKSRTMSVMDVNPTLHEVFAANPVTMGNWLPIVDRALADAEDVEFRVPATKVLRMPLPMAQFTRMEYASTNRISRETLNRMLVEIFDLEDPGVYFIKTGTFSSKFEFANAKCAEPAEMGEYFQVITNTAMSIGAGDSVELVVREYIEDVDDSPTIYHGMPLRCEARAFIDLESDAPRLLGVVPYWHPSVMRRALAMAEEMPWMSHVHGDAAAYAERLPWLEARFDELLPRIISGLEKLLPELKEQGLGELYGQWSVDIMAAGDDLWLIDMATMHTSALAEVLAHTDEYATADLADIAELAGRIELNRHERSARDVFDVDADLYDSTTGACTAVDFTGVWIRALSGAAEALGVTPELSPGDAAELVALVENTAVAAVDDQAVST